MLPLLKDTGRILLLTVPTGLERNIQQVLLQILAMDGVKGYKSPRFWTHSMEVFTGSLHIQVTNETNEQGVIRQVNSLFSGIGFSHFVVQVEKDEFIMNKNKNIIDIDDGDDDFKIPDNTRIFSKENQPQQPNRLLNNSNTSSVKTVSNPDSNLYKKPESSFDIALV